MEVLFFIVSVGPMYSQWSLTVEEKGRRVTTRCDYGKKTQTDSALLALLMEGGGNEPKNGDGLWKLERNAMNFLLKPAGGKKIQSW